MRFPPLGLTLWSWTMQAGNLRERVGFYRRAMASDGYGNSEGAFPAEPEFSVAANIKPRLGGEQVLQSRLQGVNLVNITVRWSSETAQVEPDWIVKNERTGEVYNIRSIINPDERRRFIEMLCERGASV